MMAGPLRRCFTVASQGGAITIDNRRTTAICIEKGEVYAFFQGGGTNSVRLGLQSSSSKITPYVPVTYYTTLSKSSSESNPCLACLVTWADFDAAIKGGGYGFYVIQPAMPENADKMVLYVDDDDDDDLVIVEITEPVPRIQTGDYVWVEMKAHERAYSAAPGDTWGELKLGASEDGSETGTVLCARLILSINLTLDASRTLGSLGVPVAPTVSSATIENAAPNIIVLTFSKSLAASVTSPAADFVIVVDDAEAVAPTAAIIDGMIIRLTTVPIQSGQVVYVAYTPSADQDITDADGIAAIALTSQFVSNRVE